MNQLRNIKEMLGISTGTRNVSTSAYPSLTESQLFFGSQFWPENSQGASQDMSISSRTSQQSSQEGSDSKFSNSYHTKPLLFGELKDKTRGFGILDKFEEDRKKAKEKSDNDVLTKECRQIRETLSEIQHLIAGTEKNTISCQTVLEKIDCFASTLKHNLASFQSDISHQFETLLNKVNCQKEVMTELEERVKKGGDATEEHGSELQSLKMSLESLRDEQERGRKMLEEALKLLSTLVSEHSAKPSSDRIMDSAIQTSPGLEESLSNILGENKLEGTQLACVSQNLQRTTAEVLPRDSSCVIGKRKFAVRNHRRRKKRPLVPSQRRRCISDENSQLFMNCNNKQNISPPFCEQNNLNTVTTRDGLNPDCLITVKRDTRSSETPGSLITPLNCWSQDSSSSACVAGIKPILEKLSAGSKADTPMKHENLWQLFDMDCDSDLSF